MFTKIQMYNNKPQLTRATSKKYILDRCPLKIVELMPTTILTDKADEDIVHSVQWAVRTAEKWEEWNNNLE